MVSTQHTSSRWASAWPDVLAFALGLGVARFAGWTTTDLVWSLWLSSLVVGVLPIDPLSLIASAMFLAGATVIAAYVPARRATRVDPIIALRAE